MAAAASVLAALLRPAGRDPVLSINEDGQDAVVLGRLREAGLITYPSPLLGRLLGELPQVLEKEVLAQLDSVDRTMLAQVGRPWRAAVVDSRLPRLPMTPTWRLPLAEFCTSVDRLAWAKANGCPWGVKDLYSCSDHGGRNPCALAARGGHRKVLKWARAHGCPWDDQTCTYAAQEGHLGVLRWAWMNGCELDGQYMCDDAVRYGHLEVLKWALEHGREWEDVGPENVCHLAAEGGHLELLKWAPENDYEWDKDACEDVCDHPETLAWIQQQPDSISISIS